MKFILDCPTVKEITDNGVMNLINGFDLNSKINNSLPIAEKVKIIEKLSKKISKDDIIFIGLNSQQTLEQRVAEATEIAKVSESISIAFEPGLDSLKLCNALVLKGISTSLSPCINLSEAIAFAKCGVNFIFTPIGKMEDISINGIEIIAQIKSVLDNYPDFITQTIARSIRSLIHVNEAARVGVDGVCLSSEMIVKMAN